MRQLIILRKDILKDYPGKAAAQACHASMAFLTAWLRDAVCYDEKRNLIHTDTNIYVDDIFSKDIWDNWFCGSYTKTVCEAKNKNDLLKVITKAQELGLKEGKDYFLIKDNCLTVLEPEEVDENGVGRTLTAIGFRPLSEEISHELSKKYHLYV